MKYSVGIILYNQEDDPDYKACNSVILDEIILNIKYNAGDTVKLIINESFIWVETDDSDVFKGLMNLKTPKRIDIF